MRSTGRRSHGRHGLIDVDSLGPQDLVLKPLFALTVIILIEEVAARPLVALVCVGLD